VRFRFLLAEPEGAMNCAPTITSKDVDPFIWGARAIFAKSSPVFQRATTRVASTCYACSAQNVGATLVVALPTYKNPTHTLLSVYQAMMCMF